ncbi:hypothetical protein BJP34_04185 [Moorena producens PAL-8-15-08-1]|uniref:Uncharacterized protein n=1 Tax=Moorena producens PAL-8-15-08-1 TaxID=1458985 RepID=A0A1D8TMC8_9CYAN|nr:hypothetical protein BJP34_04185 [Moorena producens PAL-8-15-08-1]
MNYVLSEQAKTHEGAIALLQMLCISDMLPVKTLAQTSARPPRLKAFPLGRKNLVGILRYNTLL